jgi:hypothetical protein
MGAENNVLTLEGLAQRLEALERENERVRSENDALQSKVATLEGSGTTHRGEVPARRRGLEKRRGKEDASEEFKGQVSRRSLLSKAGAAAVAATAATLLDTRQAKAHNDNTVISPGGVNTHWVQALNHADSGSAFYGEATTNLEGAVQAHNYGSGPGVRGVGVVTNGVVGESSRATYAGVKGEHTGTEGSGVYGEGWTGVWGHSSKTGYSGVYGQHTGLGYGGQFEGGKAQLRLKPGSSRGAPTGAHLKGEIYMDSAGVLFVCTVGGTPGTWRKVSTTAA